MRKRKSAWGAPHAPTETRWGKRGIALFLSAAMCLSMLPTMALADNNTAATTDEYGFDLSTPSGFDANDGNQPFGRGAGIKGNLNPTKEISILESSGSYYSSRVYDFDESSILKGSGGGVFSSSDHYAGLDSTKFSTAAATKNTINKGNTSPYYYVSAMAFDPNGNGRNDKVAYWGATRGSGSNDYRMQLNVFKENSGNFNSNSIKYRGSDADGAYSWMSKLSGYNAEGYTAITAGDFDGSGKETVVFYDPAKGNLMLKSNDGYYQEVKDVLNIGNDSTLKDYFGKTLNDIQALGGTDLQRIAENTAMVQLEAADLDGKADNKDELIVTVSLGNLYNEAGVGERGSVVMVLSKKGNSWETVWSYQFSHVYAGNQPDNKYDAGWHLRAAASRAEDIDHDNSMEIVTAGVGADDNGNDDNFHDEGYFAVITDYTGNGYKVDTTTQTFKDKDVSCQNGIYVKQNGDKNNEWVGTKGDDLWYMNPCSLGIVRFDGRGTVPYIVIRGQIFKYNGSTLEAANIETDGLNNVLKDRKIINQPIVGNFDGNAAGREQILFTVSSGDGDAVNIGGYYYKPSDYDSSKATGSYQSTGKGKNVMNDTENGLRSCRWGMNAWGIAEITLAAPDIDTDGLIAEYQSKEYAFNDPQVLAVMEAPPYFEDIEYNNAGETAISFSKGSGSSTGTSTANRIGAYVSFEQDFSFGGVVDLGGFEFETAFEAEWNNSIEIEKSFTMTNSFSTEQAESAVVLICIPVTIYHYNTTSADGSKSTMDITVADAPTYKTIPLSEYNAAAAQRGDPQIGSDIIASTAGQPSTYRSTTTGLKNAVTTSTGTNGGWFATEAGESSKSQSVAFDTTKTNTKELTFNVDAKAGAGVGGFKFGLSGGTSTGSSTSRISTEGIERSGTVHDLPSGTEGYSFSWQFVGWETTLKTGGLSYNVPVLSYLVQNVKQPPSKLQNLEATEVTTNSMTLEWESGFSTAAQYQVYRYMPNNTSGTKYALLGTVSGLAADKDGKYTLTDTKVQPSTQYQYVLKSVGTDGRSTDYTDPLAVTTLATGDKPTITEQPVNTSVRPGTDAVFTISATPTGGADSVTYRWQSRTDGGRWTDLNEIGDRLTIKNTTKDMDGTEYRCIVSQTDLSTEKSSVVYSNTVKLTVGKAGSETTLSTSGTGGSATHETTGTAATKTVTAQYNINDKTYQKYENAYTGDNALKDVYGTSETDGYKYYAMSPSLGNPDSNGVYTGTVSDTPTELKTAADRVTLNETAYEIGSSGFQKNQQTAKIGEETYTVYTATGVAGEKGKTDTLTLYLGEDGNYYRKDSSNNPVEMTGKDTIGDTDTNTYRTDSLTPVYVTEGDYTVLTYTPTGGSELKIYEQNGTYYSKNDSTYTSLPLVTGLYKDTNGKLFKPGAAVTTEITVSGSKKQVTGDSVTLKATVSTDDSTAATNGTVTFEITNTTTGNVVRYQVSKSSENPTVTYDWTPSEAGVYSIVAIFGGNSETNGSRSGAVTYYAKAADDLYEIAVNDCTYGDKISPSLQRVTINNGTGSASGADKTVTYAAYKDGSSDKVTGWESGKTLVPGTYRITATESGNEIASKYITVSKKPITITAPTAKGGPITFTDKDGKLGFVTGDDYADLFKTEGMPTDTDPAGVYNVSVVYDESIDKFADKQAEFFSKYTPMLKNSMVLVQADIYKVTYSNGNNGTLKGYQGGNSTSFESGAAIASGSKVTFVATPAANYQVRKWTVKSDGQELIKGSDYTLSDDNKTLTVSSLQKNLDVHVEFSNQFYTVSAQSGENGSVTATVNGSPTLGSMLSGTEVTFTATPKSGYVIKQWTVTRGTGAAETQTNTDGSVFSGKELKLTITANTTVNVTFDEMAQYTVHYSAVKQEDYTSVPLNFETTGLTDGKGEKGSTVTLTAKPSSAMGIAGWQYKTSKSGEWIDSRVTGLSYTIRNLQSNTWVRALVNDGAAPTPVSFSIVNGNGDPVPDGGTLTAKYTANGEKIQSGDGCTTYSSITFTYEEPTAYEVVTWKVNDNEVTTDRNGKIFTYTIDSLTTKTTVNVVVRPKPTVAITPPTNGTIKVDYTLNGKTVTPEEGKYVYSGTRVTVTATPKDNNYVATTVKAAWGTENISKSNSSMENGKLTLTDVEIKANTTFSAAFEEKPVVTIKTATGGTVTVKGTVNGTAVTPLATGAHVDFGTNLDVTLAPDKGYEVGNITGATPQYTDGDKNGTTTDNKSYAISDVQSNQTITPVWSAIPTTTVNWSVIDKTPNTDGGTDGTLKATVTRKGMSNYAVPDSTAGTLTVSAAYTLNTVSYAVNYGVTSENGTLTAKNGGKTFDSGAKQSAGSTIVFTAQPKDGYQVKGWYTAAEGGSAIPDTTSEQNSYTITNLTDEATVYVAFEPIPTYDITLSTTGLGHVTATVNGKNTDITDGKLTVSRHDNVVLTAVPDANQYLTGWTLDDETEGNSSLSLTLDDVTDGHTVKADFAASQLVTLKTVCGANGTLTAQAGYGDALQTIDASSTTGIQVEKGKKVVLTVVPTTGYMVKMWTVNGTVQDNLSNTLTIENLSENTEVKVAFEPYVGFVIPTSDNDWTVSNVKRTPDDTTPVTEIRKNGTVTFTVAPVSGKYLTALKVNGKDYLTEIRNDGETNKLTVVNNQDGSYTITVANVTNNIALEVTSMQFRTEKTELTVPEVLKEKYADTDALKTALQIALRTQVDKVNASVPAANIQYYDIKLQYTTDGGETWIDATKEHFPAGGITVQILYSELKSGLDSSYTYTVIHMFTTDMKGHTIGDTESITPTNGENGISFTVNSLSPFAIGWYKTSGNPGGGGAGGGGGGGAVAPTTYDVVIPSALANIVKTDKTKAAADDTVTLTVSGEGTLTVTDANGKSVALTDLGSGKYTFKMPSSKVNVAFAASGETKPCDGGKDCPSAPFKDVDTGKWYHVSIDYVLTHSIMNGVSGTSFAPNSNLTRGMLVQILFNLEGKPQSASASFSDVKADAWYAKAIGWAAANKVVTGYADGTFRPNAAVTREQTAAILYRYAQSKGIDVSAGEDTNILSYADALQASEYAIPALQWAVGAGVLNGKSGNLLAPTGTATRAEIAAIMQRWCEKIVQK